ncbi:hypothetical protein B0J13DRAFT_585329 [Dactylonectria estremocensis]|uniref:Uncharacterized protein n=1 Tax=Dactylonectria estremocensis TaxID=1079267 RepID=A0A9P9EQU4_9HYPO|nr:hypothetical protein B0J13DRAFT_585329 [Dactylonectria estremocensis]
MDVLLGSYDPRAHFPHWQRFLSHQPVEPLSFRKTQAALPQPLVNLKRTWDIDSIWLGATDLAAIRAPSDFRLSFLPPFALNLSTDQVIQPHGLDLVKTRHIPLGSFKTPAVRFSVFVFFPSSARTSGSKPSASSNALSLERQKDLYDNIIIPAAYETIRDPEKPGMGRWRADDESRSFNLSYTLPAEDLPLFWRSVVEKANQLRISTQRGEAVAYFQRPCLLF